MPLKMLKCWETGAYWAMFVLTRGELQTAFLIVASLAACKRLEDILRYSKYDKGERK